MLTAILAGAVLLFILAYLTYGRFLEKRYDVQADRPTPSHTDYDGVDRVPAHRAVLLGHHFSSIAGAGPVVGPIIAAIAFGWLPVLLWVLFGSILIGGVHDYSALVMSLRHRGRSIAEICRLYLSPLTYRCLLVFIWLALVYVLIVFLDMTAASFTTVSADHPSDGGTVAGASVLYILLAVVFGVALRRGWLTLRTGSLIFVPLVFFSLALASWFPISPELLPQLIHDNPKYTWSLVLIVYCFVASVAPVWLLLQPRDYLSSYLLFACLVFGGLGMLLGSLGGGVPLQYPAFKGLVAGNGDMMFPVLFITVACGAVSGFHCIVASGTTARQCPTERAAKPIAYGAMLTEGALAVVALSCIMALPATTGTGGVNPNLIFSAGVGNFLSTFGVPVGVGATFGLLAISTFLLTTLDTCTRLARYLVEEFFGLQGKGWRHIATFVSLAPLFYFAFAQYPDPANPGAVLPAWRVVWPAFGTTNQLMAALALVVAVVWRRGIGRSYWFALWPAIFMLASTCTSMVQLIRTNLQPTGTPAIAWVNIVMLAMTILVVADTVWNWGRLGRRAGDTAIEAPEVSVIP